LGAHTTRKQLPVHAKKNVVILSGAPFACPPQAGAAKDLSLNILHNANVEVLRLSLSDSRRMTRAVLRSVHGRTSVLEMWVSMKLSRHQVIGSVLLALVVLAALVVRAWPLLVPK
jgi:hypothetical protein